MRLYQRLFCKLKTTKFMKPSLLELGCRLGFFSLKLVKEREFREELDGTKFYGLEKLS